MLCHTLYTFTFVYILSYFYYICFHALPYISYSHTVNIFYVFFFPPFLYTIHHFITQYRYTKMGIDFYIIIVSTILQNYGVYDFRKHLVFQKEFSREICNTEFFSFLFFPLFLHFFAQDHFSDSSLLNLFRFVFFQILFFIPPAFTNNYTFFSFSQLQIMMSPYHVDFY